MNQANQLMKIETSFVTIIPKDNEIMMKNPIESLQRLNEILLEYQTRYNHFLHEVSLKNNLKALLEIHEDARMKIEKETNFRIERPVVFH